MISSIEKVRFLAKNFQPEADALIVDTRPAPVFKSSYITNAINIQATGQFETWLGSLIAPVSKFYLIAADEQALLNVIRRSAAIGYEANIKGAFVYDAKNGAHLKAFDTQSFVPDENKYTYIDVRTVKEVKQQPVLKNSINIPLHELTDRLSEIPKGKPLLVYCASGNRSSTASSILLKYMPTMEVYDLGPAVSQYTKAK